MLESHPDGQQLSPVFEHAVIAGNAQVTSQLLGVPEGTLSVQGSLSSHLQVSGGSQVSPRAASMRPLPQPAQSESVVGPQPPGQQPSVALLSQMEIGVWMHTRSHEPALPVEVSMVHASPSSQAGQLPSQVSPRPASTRPLPQPGQSESVVGPQPPAQQPSPAVHAVMVLCAHATLQVSAPPVVISIVHASWSSQLMLAQLDGGSQVSPASTAPLPQLVEQSASVFWLQPDGQHASPAVHEVIGVCEQATLQVSALPVFTSTVQA